MSTERRVAQGVGRLFLLAAAVLGSAALSSWASPGESVRVVMRIGRGILRDVAHSPDGAYVAVATSLGIELLDSTSAEIVRVFPGDGRIEKVGSMSFSPDGALIAGILYESGLAVWDIRSGRLRQVSPRVRWPYRGNSIAFHPNGQLVASLSLGGIIALCNVGSGVVLREVRTFIAEPYSIAFSPNGQWLALTSPNLVVTYDTSTWEPRLVLEWTAGAPHPNYDVVPVAFSSDSRLLVAGGQKGVWIWDISTERLIRRLEPGTNVIVFAPGGTSVVTSDWGHLVVMDPATGRTLLRLVGHKDRLVAAAVSPDGRTIVSAGEDGTVRWWNVEARSSFRVLDGYTTVVHSVAVSPDGRVLAAGFDDGTARLFSKEDGVLRSVLTGHSWGVFDIEYSGDGRHLATASGDGSVRIWDPISGQSMGRISGFRGPVWNVEFSPDDRLLVAGFPDLYVWPVGQWSRPPVTHIKSDLSLTKSVCFSRDGKVLVVPEQERVVLLHVETWEPIDIIPYGARACAIHPDGSVLAFAPSYPLGSGKVLLSDLIGSKLILWSLESGAELKRLELGSGSVSALAFSPDGALLALSSGNLLVLLRTHSWEPVATLRIHAAIVQKIVFFPGGNLLATCADDGTIAVVDISPVRRLATDPGKVPTQPGR